LQANLQPVAEFGSKSNTPQDNRTEDGNDFLNIGRIVPEDDDETAAAKERQRKILTQRLRRSKLADAMRMENEKVGCVCACFATQCRSPLSSSAIWVHPWGQT
jgi:hypothetical protein